jgi:CarD family transcriptional regulator
MTQKKKTSVKAKAAKVVAQPKKTTPSSAAAKGVAANARPVAAAARKPAAPAAKPVAVAKAKKPVAKPVASKAPVSKPAVSAKPVTSAPVVAKSAAPATAKPAAASATAKKPASPAPVASQPRMEASKAAQAFAAHRAQAASHAPPVVAPSKPASVKPAPAARAVPAAVSKAPAGNKITTAPAQSTQPPASPKAIAEKAAAARADANKKPVNSRHGFKTNEFVVYPAHGVGRIVGIEEQEIAGMSLELFVINFEKEKLTLRVPTGKLQSVGMRKLADDDIVKRAMEILKGRARIKRTMWSRRAQEYVAKINSGDLISIAEVVRDLYRSEAQPEQSYSERQLYEDALDRMAREIAAVEKLDDRGAVQRITEVLSKSAKGRRLAEVAGDEGEEVAAA